MDLNKLHALAELADQLENQGFIVEANNVHNLFLKQADQFNEKHLVELPHLKEKERIYSQKNTKQPGHTLLICVPLAL
jgi:hypothetical protein